MKKFLSEYTEKEFVEFLHELRKENKAPTDVRFDILIQHFINVTEHPAGTDLIFYPEKGADTSAEGITKTIKDWRIANHLPTFKIA